MLIIEVNLELKTLYFATFFFIYERLKQYIPNLAAK